MTAPRQAIPRTFCAACLCSLVSSRPTRDCISKDTIDSAWGMRAEVDLSPLRLHRCNCTYINIKKNRDLFCDFFFLFVTQWHSSPAWTLPMTVLGCSLKLHVSDGRLDSDPCFITLWARAWVGHSIHAWGSVTPPFKRQEEGERTHVTSGIALIFSVVPLLRLQGIRQVVQGIIRCRSWVPHVWWSAIFFPFQIEHISYSLLLSFILDCCLKLLGFTCTHTSKIDNQILKFPFCLALAHSIFSLPKHFFVYLSSGEEIFHISDIFRKRFEAG